MRPSEDKRLIETVKVTGETYGKQISLAAMLMFLADLDNYSSDTIAAALSRCRKELKNFPTVSEVILRIDDGRPGVEEAWAMVPKDEYGSVVWNNEIAAAFAICRSLIEEDPIAARMAFKESYSKIIAENRSTGIRPEWSPSMGWDKHGRAAALVDAVRKSRITHDQANLLLPDYTEDTRNLTLVGPHNEH